MELKGGEASRSSDLKELWAEIWKIKVSQKIKTFVWKAAHNIIPVNENLFKRRIAKSPTCQICNLEIESTEHAILLCPWTRAAWFGAQCQKCPTTDTVSSYGKWVLECIKEIKRSVKTWQDVLISRIAYLSWKIWKTRNQVVFQKIGINPASTIHKAKMAEIHFIEATQDKQTENQQLVKRRDRTITWRPPPKPWVKANIDASFKATTGTGATAVTIRDSTENLVFGATTKIMVCSSLAAETLTIRNAIILSKNMEIKKMLIESDNLMLVQTRETEFGFTWTPREENRLTHKVAALEAMGALERSWIIRLPSEIIVQIRKDAPCKLKQHNRNGGASTIEV
ncbi:hypothetical protein Ahy_B10g101001 [Arachis hypogaea]|uniref:Reverse transcriptase zinc-binding domain-containing protein n=1 Tax=Arachis hypogaea TaxID=3818 RepID=A0A444WYB0_ARAHY|nr:hypothetical protein Ahy_B10g101001 [Arachis hypogaea]